MNSQAKCCESHRLAEEVAHSPPIWNFLFHLELDCTELAFCAVRGHKTLTIHLSGVCVWSKDRLSWSLWCIPRTPPSHRGSEEELAFFQTLQIAALWAAAPTLCCKLSHPRPTWLQENLNTLHLSRKPSTPVSCKADGIIMFSRCF